MTAKFFVDTSILLYAGSKAPDEGTVYSEDLNAGQDYDGVIVVNPFAGATP